jgi:hypothetical protein
MRNAFVVEDMKQPAVEGSFNNMFDYASFMWDHELQNGNMQPARWRDLGFSDMDVMGQRDEFVSYQSFELVIRY